MLYQTLLLIASNSWKLWFIPDAYIEKALLTLGEAWRNEHGLGLELLEAKNSPALTRRLLYHDVVHALIRKPPTKLGEGCVDSFEQAVSGRSFDPKYTFAGDLVDQYETLEYYYSEGVRLHPVVKRILRPYI